MKLRDVLSWLNRVTMPSSAAPARRASSYGAIPLHEDPPHSSRYLSANNSLAVNSDSGNEEVGNRNPSSLGPRPIISRAGHSTFAEVAVPPATIQSPDSDAVSEGGLLTRKWRKRAGKHSKEHRKSAPAIGGKRRGLTDANHNATTNHNNYSGTTAKGNKKHSYGTHGNAARRSSKEGRAVSYDETEEGYKSLENLSHSGFIAPPFLFPSADELLVVEEEGRAKAKSESEGTPQSLPPLTRKQIFVIGMLAFANFCSTVVFSCIAPFFPDEAAKKGATKTEIGLIFGVFELTMFVFSPIFGRYLTTIGAKFMYGAGLFVTGCTSILFGLVTLAPSGSPFVGLCFAIRIVEAIGDSMFITASFAIIASNFPGRVATIIGLLETFNGLGFTAGPAVGGMLYQAGGFMTPFMALGALLFGAAVLSLPLIPVQDDAPRHKVGGIFTLLSIPAILLMCSAIMVCAICLTYLDPTLEPHLDDFHLSPMLVGLMFLLTGGVYTITAPIWGYYIDKSPHAKELMIFGAVTSMIAMFFIGPSPITGLTKSLWLIAISQVILGLGVAAFFIPTFKCSLEVASDYGYPDSFETYGLISGLFQSFFSLGGFIGPTIGGISVDHIGFEWTSTILAGINLLVAIAIVVFMVYARWHGGGWALGAKGHFERLPILSNVEENVTCENQSPDSGLDSSKT